MFEWERDLRWEVEGQIFTVRFLNRLLAHYKSWYVKEPRFYQVQKWRARTVICLNMVKNCPKFCNHSFPHMVGQSCTWAVCPVTFKHLNCVDLSLFKPKRLSQGFDKVRV